MSSNGNANLNVPIGYHYLAEIKYPNIPDIISIDKIFNVLQKIRTTSKPLFYKWLPLDKPKHGEIFLEQKYPLTRDPIGGDQFPIVDDGYLWSSIPKPEIRDHQGHQIEIYRWFEGYSPGDQFFSISKTEYRLRIQNNVLFLIHYLIINRPQIPVRSALPATKVSPTYLQQQYFQNLKQQMAQLSSSSRPASPNISSSQQRAPSSSATTTTSSINNPKVFNQTSTNKTTRPVNSVEETILGSSLDIFDSYNEYDSAAFRFSAINGFFTNLFLQPNNLLELNSNVPLDLEEDFIAAIQKKTSSCSERSEKLSLSFESELNNFKSCKEKFWNFFKEFENVSTEQELTFLSTKYCQLYQNQINEDAVHMEDKSEAKAYDYSVYYSSL